MDVEGGRRVFYWLGPSSSGDNSSGSNKQQKVCFNWQQGKCNRFPCPFLHSELLNTAANGKRPHQGFRPKDNHRAGGGAGLRRSYNFSNNKAWERGELQQPGSSRTFIKKLDNLFIYWVEGNGKFRDNCKYLHQWSTGGCFSLLMPLEGHRQDVVGSLVSSC